MVTTTTGWSSPPPSPIAPETRWRRRRAAFTTSNYAFRDIQGTPYATQIHWIGVRHIVPGCGSERFCPTGSASRTATAVALDRALDLPTTDRNPFTDDDGTRHEGAINRVAAAGLMTKCGTARFCPEDFVRRSAMAIILVDAFDLPAATARLLHRR